MNATWTPVGGQPPLVCAHRGASARAPENTIEAAQLAGDHGATWIEFDVRPSADGLVVHHDPTLADGIVVAETTRAVLPEAVPSFGDFVAAAGRLGLDIEMKTDGIGCSAAAFAELVADEVDRHCADRGYDEVIVTSFDLDALDAFHELRPAVATGVLFHDRTGEWAIRRALDDGHAAIAPWFRLVTPSLVDRAHEHGLAVATWTVNEERHVRRVAQAGVDLIIGDDPAALVDTLAAR